MRGFGGLASVLVVVALGACSSSGGHHASATTSSSSTTSSSTTSTTVAVTTTTAALARNIKVYGDCKTATFEPSEVVMACGDFGLVYGHLSWTSWTSTSATAVGMMSYKTCEPNCAEGGIRNVPNTRITLSKPVRDPNGQLVWSQLQASQVPPGRYQQPQSIPTQPD